MCEYILYTIVSL